MCKASSWERIWRNREEGGVTNVQLQEEEGESLRQVLRQCKVKGDRSEFVGKGCRPGCAAEQQGSEIHSALPISAGFLPDS